MMMQRAIELRARSRAFLVAGLLCCLPLQQAFAAGNDKPYSSWFKYGSEAEAAWVFAAEADKPLQLTIRPKNADQTRPLKKVLVLYPRASSAYDTEITRILRVFNDKDINANFTVINFQIADAAGKAALQYAEANKFDLIYSMGSESTAWLYANYRGGALPVVTVCSKDPVQLNQMRDYESGSGSNFAFTSLNVQVEVQIAHIRALSPELKNLGILIDTKNISAVKTQAEPIAEAVKKLGIEPIMVQVNDPARAADELARAIPESIRTMRKSDPDLQNSVFLITGSTSVFKEIATINKYAGRIPVISMIPEIVQPGPDTALLGIGVSFESNGHLAAIYGADILNGRAKAGEMKVGVVLPPDIAISFMKARQIGIKIPFHFFESASYIYDVNGQPVRAPAAVVASKD
jgi:putative ABC transport system substrate-binding protein